MAGMMSLGFGLLGVVLPLLPTVPLIILAAFCFARSSETMHQWLVEHPKLGPGIADWRAHGAISRKGKRLATLSIGMAFGISVAMGVALNLLILQGVVLSCTLLFIWTRPSGPRDGHPIIHRDKS
jgi:uncharacterized membrane protein YbaN (DUF454 family)